MHYKSETAHISRRRSSVVVGAAAALLLLLTACSGGAEPGAGAGNEATSSGEPVTIRIATSVDEFYGYIAVEANEALGTWKDSGLNVEVISATTPTLGQILAGGQADIGLGTPGTEAAARAQGVQQTIVASCLTPWDYVVIVSNKGKFPGAKELADLKGANFGITGKGSPGNYLLHKWADKLGWGAGDIHESALGNVAALFAALDSGQVDAVLWASDKGFVTEGSGTGTFFTLPKIEESVLQSFSVMDDFAAKNPEAVKTFFEYYFKEVKELQANPQEFIDILVNNWGYDPDVASKLAERSLPLLSTDGKITQEELDGVQQSIPFLTGKPGTTPPDIAYTYWKDLK